ncbi:phospholipase D alpha 1-like [Chenopodium quinoa]|uniref:phospholipase D alpha 1-like n=1 Tax=Chenopodium quinoa TaxID=63459 RepID=UPI000B79AB1D|nr:phospholipase D alpha 1-like [Chenopodium quinoa]
MNRRTTLLHGVLYAQIHEIDKLHLGCGLTLLKQSIDDPRRVWRTLLYRIKGYCACSPQLAGFRLYATIDLDKARVARTKIITTPSRPRWSQPFRVYCAHEVSNIIFTVKDENPVSATLIGRAYLPVREVISGRPVDRWLEIFDESGNSIRSQIHVSVQFLDVTRDPNWSQGIQSPHYGGVPSSFFRQRQGCKVSLYQDAHVSDNFTPSIMLHGGKNYESRRCWEDIFDAIVNAKYLIYIAGWSVNTKITLIRDPRRQKAGGDLPHLSLGELLKEKAKERDMRVLILVWDDITSEPYNRQGLMGTHDEDTFAYFLNTNVRCIKCPRRAGQGLSTIRGVQVDAMLTHHQKTVVVDCESPGSLKRIIVSFLGGIDLCDGRYDTQDHSLFRTLKTIHKDDFHQPNFPGASIQKGGPREPWHDIHCRLEGPVAWDVLYNFEQRWTKQKGKQFLYSLDELKERITKPFEVMTAAEEQESWNVQIFRSIDGGSVVLDGEPGVGFPSDPNKAFQVGLYCDRGSIIDRSIQDGYINAIRRAKNFIYIENQYFLGSSYAWKPEEDIDALHIIPKELSLKIISKIEAGERFSVYVVIPMWPEGEPESGAVQAILYWQRRTMEMMYTDIANAIRRMNLNAHPKDYLSFFCLGNREVLKTGEDQPAEKPVLGTTYDRAQHNRRFMIYVHAKMMIVDDEYIIIGSANINQRSMDGGRDTEIAMGAYQPHHLSAGQPAKAHIYGFRMALWYEHIHYMHESFLYPETLECMQVVNSIAEKYWKIYSSETFDQDLPGHLLRYPIEVTSFGHITPLSEDEKFFPDTIAPVLGTKSDLLPPILTT